MKQLWNHEVPLHGAAKMQKIFERCKSGAGAERRWGEAYQIIKMKRKLNYRVSFCQIYETSNESNIYKSLTSDRSAEQSEALKDTHPRETWRGGRAE